MDHNLKQDETVKEISIGSDCLNIDLLSGLRLSGPLVSNDDAVRASGRLRKMMVSGHDGMSSQAYPFS